MDKKKDQELIQLRLDAQNVLDKLAYFDLYRQEQKYQGRSRIDIYSDAKDVAKKVLGDAKEVYDLDTARDALVNFAKEGKKIRPPSQDIKVLAVHADKLGVGDNQIKGLTQRLSELERKQVVINQAGFQQAARGAGLTQQQAVDLSKHLPENPFTLAQKELAKAEAASLAAREIYSAPTTTVTEEVTIQPQTTYTPTPTTSQSSIEDRQQGGPGIVGDVAGKGVGVVTKKAGKEIAKRAATSTTASVILKGAGAISGYLSGGVLWVASWAGSRAMIGIKKNSGRIMASIGVMGGLLLGGPIGAAIGGMLGAALGGTDWKEAREWGYRAGAAVGAYIFAGVAIFIVRFLVFSVILTLLGALIFLIINNSAYVVPQGKTASGTVGNNSPFIDVTKTVDPNPSDGFENGDSRLKSVKFTVTIKATTSTLTLGDKPINDVCKIIQEQNNTPNCPEKKDFPTDFPKTLNLGQSYTFSYTMDLSDPNLKDAFVSNIVTVIADASGEQGAESSAGTSVKIGNPPEQCPSGWPVNGRYGITRGPHIASHALVQAIDIGVPMGTPIYATHSGKVSRGGLSAGIYGVYVRIISSCNGQRFESIYGHLGSSSVSEGQEVTRGTVIGRSDNTGNSSGPHLHYEFNRRELPMIPPYIPRAVPEKCNSTSVCGSTN